jgi:hypothetical protein
MMRRSSPSSTLLLAYKLPRDARFLAGLTLTYLVLCLCGVSVAELLAFEMYTRGGSQGLILTDFASYKRAQLKNERFEVERVILIGCIS